MILLAKNNRQFSLSALNPEDFDRLTDYLQRLSLETLRRFGPHKFDKLSIVELFMNSNYYHGYIAQDTETLEIIAYSVVKIGYLEHDSSRLRSYGLIPDHETDCTFAPSVADQWQSLGVGNSLFKYILSDLKTRGIQRIILWGGVQSDNFKAVNFYIINGFRTLGQFEYNGQNYDMILEII
jgi:diamine N-acetyltransferase